MEEKINDSKITADEKISINDIKPDKSLRILTGIRPTGHLHIGHYFGAAHGLNYKINLILLLKLQMYKH